MNNEIKGKVVEVRDCDNGWCEVVVRVPFGIIHEGENIAARYVYVVREESFSALEKERDSLVVMLNELNRVRAKQSPTEVK